MIGRLLRHLALVIGVALLAYISKRVVDDRTYEQRLAHPVTAWPDVPIADVEAPDVTADTAAVEGDGFTPARRSAQRRDS